MRTKTLKKPKKRKKLDENLDDDSFALSRDETADKLRICTKTLDNWCKLEGGPPFVQFQNRKIFPRVQLENWLAENVQ